MCHIPHSAPAAGQKFVCAGRTSGNTALTAVIFSPGIKTVTAMLDNTRIQAYHSAMAQARLMLRQGILDHSDIVSIEDRLAVKYGLPFGSIYREIDLINVAFRANMDGEKG